MKKVFSLCLIVSLLAVSHYSFAQNTPVPAATEEVGIHFFHGSWNELMAEAKKQNKPIFVDAYAVWCGPCRQMAATVFTDKEVGEYYNKNFINYKFDMEKGEGPEFARKYKVEAYPTLFYFDDNGDMKNRVLGGQYKDGLLNEGKKAIGAIK